jgi:hypothetical protein
LSSKREQIIKRENKLLQKENMQRLTDKKKEIDKQIKTRPKRQQLRRRRTQKTIMPSGIN